MNMTTLLSAAEGVAKFGDGIKDAAPGDKVVFSLQVVLIGMGVVFGVLLLLIGILQLFKLFAVKNNEAKPSTVPAQTAAPAAATSAPVAAPATASGSEEQTVVAIASAAIAAARGQNNVDFNIISIAPIGKSVASPAPAAPVAAPAPAAAPAPVAETAPAPAAAAPAAAPADGEKINAPLPGNVLDVKVAVGASVKKGDILCILEAMKMENEIVAPIDGTVATVAATKGSSVNTGDLLFVIG